MNNDKKRKVFKCLTFDKKNNIVRYTNYNKV